MTDRREWHHCVNTGKWQLRLNVDPDRNTLRGVGWMKRFRWHSVVHIITLQHQSFIQFISRDIWVQFILFVGLSWSILFLSHICTRIWIFHIIIFFFVLIFVSFLNCSIQNFCVCGVFWSASFVFLSVMLGEGRVLITNKSLTVSDIQLVINSHNYG